MKPDFIDHITINNIRFPVWHYGNPKNPSIIVLHGHPIPFSHYSDDFPIKYLKEEFYFTTFDLPGYGYANELHEDTNIVIDKIIKECLPKKKHIIFGTSYGGLTAIKYSMYSEEHLKGLIIAGMPYFKEINIKIISIVLSLIKKNKLSFILKQFSFLNKNNLSNIEISKLLIYSKKDKLATLHMGENLNKRLNDSKLFLLKDRPHSSLLGKSNQNGTLQAIKEFTNTLKD